MAPPGTHISVRPSGQRAPRGDTPFCIPARPISAHNPFAAVGALAAGHGAIFHPLQALAVRRAGPAGLGALAADIAVMLEGPRHEIERGRANLRAVDHRPEVRGFGVLAAHLQAMGLAVKRRKLIPRLESGRASDDIPRATTVVGTSIAIETGSAIVNLALVAWLGTLAPPSP